MIWAGVLANHILPLLGVIYIVITVWKMAKGFPIKRWFF